MKKIKNRSFIIIEDFFEKNVILRDIPQRATERDDYFAPYCSVVFLIGKLFFIVSVYDVSCSVRMNVNETVYI